MAHFTVLKNIKYLNIYIVRADTRQCGNLKDEFLFFCLLYYLEVKIREIPIPVSF